MTKKEIVIEKARELFTKYGYKKVSMDEIAKESGVTKKTIYAYFKDKDSMFQYFVLEDLEKMKQILEKKRDSHICFIDFVSSYLYEMLIYRKNSLLISTIAKDKLMDNDGKQEGFLKLYDDGIIKYIEEKIKQEIEDGNIKKCNAHFVAFILYKVYIAVMFEYDEELDEKQVTEEVTAILKDGLFN